MSGHISRTKSAMIWVVQLVILFCGTFEERQGRASTLDYVKRTCHGYMHQTVETPIPSTAGSIFVTDVRGLVAEIVPSPSANSQKTTGSFYSQRRVHICSKEIPTISSPRGMACTGWRMQSKCPHRQPAQVLTETLRHTTAGSTTPTRTSCAGAGRRSRPYTSCAVELPRQRGQTHTGPCRA